MQQKERFLAAYEHQRSSVVEAAAAAAMASEEIAAAATLEDSVRLVDSDIKGAEASHRGDGGLAASVGSMGSTAESKGRDLQGCVPMRPVTLIGYGMGARVVFECLVALAREGGPAARGIVETAVLLGAPVGVGVGFASGIDGLLGHEQQWHDARSVVAGRFINCYSHKDWVLALQYRQKSLDTGVAGLHEVHLQKTHSSHAATVGAGMGTHTAATGGDESRALGVSTVAAVAEAVATVANTATDSHSSAAAREQLHGHGDNTVGSTHADLHTIKTSQRRNFLMYDDVENFDVSALVSSQVSQLLLVVAGTGSSVSACYANWLLHVQLNTFFGSVCDR